MSFVPATRFTFISATPEAFIAKYMAFDAKRDGYVIEQSTPGCHLSLWLNGNLISHIVPGGGWGMGPKYTIWWAVNPSFSTIIGWCDYRWEIRTDLLVIALSDDYDRTMRSLGFK